MAKAKKSQFHEFARQPPRLSIVSDNPLRDDEVENEQFNLRYRIGPIFDIIRHNNTETPMTIAIYGTWGTGKTTAMWWLSSLLLNWNKAAKKTHRKVRTVWFYPWKYHTKEDVWRGLVSEVILKSIDVKEMTGDRVKKAVKDFGLFLGRSFINVVASTTMKAAGVDSSVTRTMLDDLQGISHPEKAFLNEFEETLKKWIDETISSKNERMVIFIDDLDRCTPDVAFEVLEALKLYLNITDLICVVGLDRDIIDKIVVDNYKKMGFKTDAELKKCRQYLGKMFQVEVKVGPSVKQIRDYTDYILDKNEFLKENLEANEYHAVNAVILSLGGRNPREIKRLVNSALMEGMGAGLISQDADGGEKTEYTVAQGVQLFLIDTILQRRYPHFKDLIGSGDDVQFFGRWSRIVRENFTEDLSKASFKLPKDLASKEAGLAEPEVLDSDSAERPELRVDLTAYKHIPPEFHHLLQSPEHSSYFKLLEDEDLARLMIIEYPRETGLISQAKEQIDQENEDDQKIFENEIRRIVNVETGAITDELYESIDKFNLRGKGLKTLPPAIAKLTALQTLSLRYNQLTTLPEEIGELTKLQTLDLFVNQLTTLPEAISKLTALQKLELHNNQLTTVPEKIGELAALQKLGLSNNQFAALPDAIGELAALQELGLTRNQLTTLPKAIGKLAALRWLNVADNQLTTLPEEIGKLTTLQSLNLADNQFTTLPEAIAKLTALQSLRLSDNKLSALPEAIGELAAVQELHLSNNQLTMLPEAIAKLNELQQLSLENNQLTTFPEAIAKLSALRQLSLANNQLTTLSEAIGELTMLQGLSLGNNLLATLPEAIGKLTTLRRLGLGNNQLTTLPEAIARLTALKTLYLNNNYFSKTEKDRIRALLPKCAIHF
ncbi:MAG: leucine-rich repeat domain-containing protein [Planctomycetota bacterium]